MADAPMNLGDLFSKKKKKPAKGVNLNNEAVTKVDEGKKKSKDKEEQGWEEEEILAPTMLVQVAGKLVDEEVKEEQTAAAAWGNKQKQRGGEAVKLNEKKYPSLQKAVIGKSSNINIDDGSNAQINIKQSKNVFAALEDDDVDDDAPKKRPKEIKPAMVSKVKGESQKVALQREVDKYSVKKEEDKKSDKKKKKKQEDSDDSESEEDSEESEEEEEESSEDEAAARRKKKQEDKKREKAKEAREAREAREAKEAQEKEETLADDLKIDPDEVASRKKYIGREKPFDAKPLKKSELEEEKKNNSSNMSKKKKKFLEEEEEELDGKKKLMVANWD